MTVDRFRSGVACATQCAAGKQTPVAASPGSPGRSQMTTCLVVDDSGVVRKITRHILEGLDFQILEAEDGEAALEVCKRGLPDAILLDGNMSAMDAYEFLGHLRRLPGGDAPRVIFCTSENGMDHILRALHAGADEYITKPFDKHTVAAKFREAGLVGVPV
jgi:two-component system chemotaxis response regulator CheY